MGCTLQSSIIIPKEKVMKKFLIAAAVVVALSFSANAKEKELTITGDGCCAKCTLKEKDATACQNTVTVEKSGKKTVYYLTGDVSKEFHKNLCQGVAKVKATGTVKEVHGKQELTVSKIELVKDAAPAK